MIRLGRRAIGFGEATISRLLNGTADMDCDDEDNCSAMSLVFTTEPAPKSE